MQSGNTANNFTRFIFLRLDTERTGMCRTRVCLLESARVFLPTVTRTKHCSGEWSFLRLLHVPSKSVCLQMR